jgi:hypothetical protein
LKLPGSLFGAALLLAAPLSLRAEEFFAVHDENPLTRGIYLPLASDSRGSDVYDFTLELAIANTLNVENHGNESLLVDGESDNLRFTFEHQLSSAWHVRFTLPLIRDSGGFLDATVDDWHRLLGVSRGNRPYFPHGLINYSYHGVSDISLTHSAAGVGDVSGDVGYFLLDDAHQTLSLWGGLKAPTGSVADLTSNGAWDGASWLHYGLRYTHWQMGAEIGVVQPFGDELYAGHAHITSGFGRLSLARTLGANWAVRAQLDGQTRRVSDSELRLTGPSLQLTLGLTRHLWHRLKLEFGFAEDAAVNTAPDITFFLGVRG